MADWSSLDDTPAPIEVVHEAEIVPESDESSQIDRIKALEDEMLEEAMAVTKDVIDFGAIGPEDEAPPDEWVRELGAEKAMRRFRHMKAAWCGSKTAPVALGITASFVTKVIKARSVERAAPRALAIVMMPNPHAPMPLFEVRSADED